jgi:hypothetical protein
MVYCHHCRKYASLKYLSDNVVFYSCSKCVIIHNIKNAYSRLHCQECLKYGGWLFKNKRFCYDHKPSGSVSKTIKCIECNETNATFGFYKKQPIYCYKCCDKNVHVNVKTKKCIMCNNNAYFKLKNETTPKYCSDCKTDEMISIKAKYCIVKNCSEYAYYNVIGQSPIYCVNHKTSDMYVIKNKQYISNDKFTTNANKKRKIEYLEKMVKISK